MYGQAITTEFMFEQRKKARAWDALKSLDEALDEDLNASNIDFSSYWADEKRIKIGMSVNLYFSGWNGKSVPPVLEEMLFVPLCRNIFSCVTSIYCILQKAKIPISSP